jgi:hypothetical protein
MRQKILNKPFNPNLPRPVRDVVFWSRMSDEELRGAFLALDGHEHQSPALDTAIEEIIFEIQQRAKIGHLVLVDDQNEGAPVVSDDVPSWLHWWPFCLLWSQKQ